MPVIPSTTSIVLGTSWVYNKYVFFFPVQTGDCWTMGCWGKESETDFLVSGPCDQAKALP